MLPLSPHNVSHLALFRSFFSISGCSASLSVLSSPALVFSIVVFFTYCVIVASTIQSSLALLLFLLYFSYKLSSILLFLNLKDNMRHYVPLLLNVFWNYHCGSFDYQGDFSDMLNFKKEISKNISSTFQCLGYKAQLVLGKRKFLHRGVTITECMWGISFGPCCYIFSWVARLFVRYAYRVGGSVWVEVGCQERAFSTIWNWIFKFVGNNFGWSQLCCRSRNWLT